jgi:hypothetical protein
MAKFVDGIANGIACGLLLTALLGAASLAPLMWP